MEYKVCQNLHLLLIPLIIVSAVHSTSEAIDMGVIVQSDKHGT